MSECLEHNSDDRPEAGDIVVYLEKLNNGVKSTEAETEHDQTEV